MLTAACLHASVPALSRGEGFVGQLSNVTSPSPVPKGEGGRGSNDVRRHADLSRYYLTFTRLPTAIADALSRTPNVQKQQLC